MEDLHKLLGYLSTLKLQQVKACFVNIIKTYQSCLVQSCLVHVDELVVKLLFGLIDQIGMNIVCCQQRPAKQLCAVKFHWGKTYKKNAISSPWSMIVISQTGPCGCPYNKNASYKNKSIISISKPPILRRYYQKINPIFTLRLLMKKLGSNPQKFCVACGHL